MLIRLQNVKCSHIGQSIIVRGAVRLLFSFVKHSSFRFYGFSLLSVCQHPHDIHDNPFICVAFVQIALFLCVIKTFQNVLALIQ